MSDSNKIKFSKRLHKYIEYGTTKVKLMLAQKSFTDDNITFKYILNCYNSDILVIVLSSCTRKGIKARYNYMRTIKGIKANQLFILDDFAEDHRGGYYVGSDCKYDEEKVVCKLISRIIKDTSAKKVIFCGSSKGGWSALNLGLNFENSYIIAGGPQYFLADYLVDSDNLLTLKHIIGEKNSEKMEFLNQYLMKKIRYNKCIDSHKIFLHYSNKEHTYAEHIQYMLEELEKNKYHVEHDIATYENHSDISYYFPEFLVNTINKIMLE